MAIGGEMEKKPMRQGFVGPQVIDRFSKAAQEFALHEENLEIVNEFTEARAELRSYVTALELIVEATVGRPPHTPTLKLREALKLVRKLPKQDRLRLMRTIIDEDINLEKRREDGT